MALLKKGAILGSDTTGHTYRVSSGRVGAGGFGEVYRGQILDRRRDPVAEVAIKVQASPHSWHGEAYFGFLLADQDRVVRLLDAFQLPSGSGAARIVRYFLVFEWIEGGTVEDFLLGNQSVPEHALQAQIEGVLGVLALLHKRGICHADITPRNLFLRDGELVLGDLGIATQGLADGPIEMRASTPGVFAPPDQLWDAWTPSDDVYQLALIALSALAGELVYSAEVCARLLRSVSASDHLKGWLHDALGDRGDRFVDATEALAALRDPGEVQPARPPRSLSGQRVVFTGRLGRKRADVAALVRKAGAVVQGQVNGSTTVVVAGQPNPLQIGQRAGTKLFDAHRRIRRGQRIAIIDELTLDRLLRR